MKNYQEISIEILCYRKKMPAEKTVHTQSDSENDWWVSFQDIQDSANCLENKLQMSTILWIWSLRSKLWLWLFINAKK